MKVTFDNTGIQLISEDARDRAYLESVLGVKDNMKVFNRVFKKEAMFEGEDNNYVIELSKYQPRETRFGGNNHE